ncbi:hypothetical protein CALCODRAFT_373500 [Calocera cornea HHB12733]|uniref:Uncharacterized protein n=1 Tax=Calocera cornea HHB12733 TaxID=1353952 RepID=A0A165EG39_9BASI|nr:hypothetical protein CALCODRAFT_373500 [Calocera cornea HHB12733]
MFAIINFLCLAVALVSALDQPTSKRATCSTTSGAVTVVSASTGEFLGYLSANLLEGQVVLTQDSNEAMLTSQTCGTGADATAVSNANPDTYGYLTGAALYNGTLAAGSPNWVFLSTSNLGATVPNAWTDATGIPVVTVSHLTPRHALALTQVSCPQFSSGRASSKPP